MLNLCLIAATTVPRGGTITVAAEGADDQQILRLEAKGQYARVAPGVAGLLAGEPEGGNVEAHSIQPFFTGLVARSVGMAVTISVEGDTVVIEARPASADAPILSEGDAHDRVDHEMPHAGR
jgi:histidine phosphotransferase ChpT